MKVSLFTDGDRTGCVKLQAPELDGSDSPPRVVVGVLDGSGSMSGKPLQDAKLALQWVVRQLRLLLAALFRRLRRIRGVDDGRRRSSAHPRSAGRRTCNGEAVLPTRDSTGTSPRAPPRRSSRQI